MQRRKLSNIRLRQLSIAGKVQVYKIYIYSLAFSFQIEDFASDNNHTLTHTEHAIHISLVSLSMQHRRRLRYQGELDLVKW